MDPGLERDKPSALRVEWLVLSAITLGYGAYLFVAPGSTMSVLVNNLVQMAVPLLVATPLLVRAAMHASGRLRLSWALLAGAAASWGVGQALWTWLEWRGGEIPYPGPPDIGFLAAIPLLVTGVLVFPSASLRTIGRARAALDGLLITSALLFAGFGSFLGAVYESTEGRTIDRILAIVYPAGDLIAVAVVIAMLARRADRRVGPLPLVAVGIGFLAVADCGFAYLTLTDNYGDFPLTDLGWPLGFAMIAMGSRRRVAVAEEIEAAVPAPYFGLALLYLPMVPSVAVFVARSVSGQAFGPLLATVGAALGVLLVARQVVTVIENEDLTRHLEETVATLRSRERQLEFQAFHDPLTLLANRALFRDRLGHALEQRRDDPVAVLFVDLDDFKTVNDSLGHETGDDLLSAVGERLRACVRVGDTVARIGGDEFAILVEGERAASDAALLAQRVLAALEVPFPMPGRDLRITASVGLATGRHGTGERVLQDADLAMYAAKANGKARVELFEHKMRTTAVDRLELVADVHTAVENGEMVVFLQPIIDLATLDIEGHEALVRWQHPQRGLLGPAAFLGLAEETGAIVPMGWWVLEQACSQAQTWPSGYISVNMAARQVIDPNAVATVAAILARTGIDPARVVLEITESVLIDADTIGPRLHELRSLGLKLAIDDFGTGYSSLSYLTRLPVDIVKIDRSFVERLGGPQGDEVLVRAVVQLARSLGLRSVGEGVETAMQLERLQSFGCDSAQGYLFGRPQLEPVFDIGVDPKVPNVTSLLARRA